jgi:hypothetical protein
VYSSRSRCSIVFPDESPVDVGTAHLLAHAHHGASHERRSKDAARKRREGNPKLGIGQALSGARSHAGNDPQGGIAAHNARGEPFRPGGDACPERARDGGARHGIRNAHRRCRYDGDDRNFGKDIGYLQNRLYVVDRFLVNSDVRVPIVDLSARMNKLFARHQTGPPPQKKHNRFGIYPYVEKLPVR